MTIRTLESGVVTAIAAQTGNIFHFMQFDFWNSSTSADDIQYLTTAPHNMSWDSKTWQGVGGALGFNVVQESVDLAGSGVDINVSGIDISTDYSIINKILGRKYIGRLVRIWMAKLDANQLVLADPVLIFFGRMNGGFKIDEQRGEDGRPGSVTITCRATDRMGDFSRVVGIQTNVSSHQKYYPRDRFFSFVSSLRSKSIKWGKKAKV